MDNPSMPPPAISGVKRPRSSIITQSSNGSEQQAGTSNPRVKRKKPEPPQTSTDGTNGEIVTVTKGRSRAVKASNKDKEKEKEKEKDEDEEEADGEIHTKVDFNDLPDETLYKYLEQHDLLPTFAISPWQDSYQVPPHKLYATHQPTPAPEPSQSSKQPTPLPEVPPTEENPEEGPAPTTRSKTAPTRKQPTPPPPITTLSDDRTVATLSDVLLAREILAEKANSHWIKGLGGGQNRETETIVNFLYKMKVGPGRLLRVYNQNAGSF